MHTFERHIYKKVLSFILLFYLFQQCSSQGIANYGNVHNFAGGNMATSLPFVNNATVGTDYINDGNFYTTSHFENNEVSMLAGTGNTYFNGTALQNISGTNAPQFYNVIIDNNAAGLQPSSIGFTFNVAGNWVNNGIFAHNKGTIVFNGSTAKTIGGTAAKTVFYTITQSNPTLSLLHNVDVINSFAFKGVSNASLSTAGLLTIKSADSVTAQIADLTDGGTLTGNSITGDVTIERYLFAKLAWRFLATPISLSATTTITDAWREGNSSLAVSTGYGTRITGPGSIGLSGVDAYTQRGSLKYYNDVTNSFTEIAATNVSIANSLGYFIFVRGDRSVAVGSAAIPTTLRMKGGIRMYNQSFSVLPNSFQSFGNPYASRIDMRSVSKPTTADAFTIWNPNNVGLYNVGGYENYVNIGGNYWLNGITTGAGAKQRNDIESGEAAFIQSITGGNIIVHEADKATGSAMVSRGGIGINNITTPTLDITLFAKRNVADSFALLDGISLNFDDTYSNTIDNDDAKKLTNTYDNLSIKNTSNNTITNLVVERRALPIATDTILLNLTGTRVGAYKFHSYPSALANTNMHAFMIDKFLQTSTALSLANENDFVFDVTADAASKAADRFMIVFKQAVALPFTFIDIAATKNNDNTHTIPYRIANERAIMQYQLERSHRPTNFLPIKAQAPLHNADGNYNYHFTDSLPLSEDNYYRIKATAVNGQIQYSTIVKILADIKKPSISVYPNPIIDRIASLKFINSEGNYTVKLMSVDGKEIQTTQVNINSSAVTISLPIRKQVAAGNYILMISDSNKNEQIKIVIP